MQEPGGAEVNVTNQHDAEVVQTTTAEKPQGLVGRFLAAVRKPFERKSQENVTPQAPKELTPEEVEAEIAKLSAEQKNIVTRSLGDMTIADRRMVEENQREQQKYQDVLTRLRAEAANKGQASTEAQGPELVKPTEESVTVAPTEPPAEEQKVA